MIGDMHTVALVGIDGSLDWLCVPDFDSPSVFAAILDDEKGGRFKIAPVGDDVMCKQFYWPETNVLITRFLGPAGAAELTDFMPAGRAVSGGKHRLQLIRRVTAVRGILRFRMECRPAFNYARDTHTTIITADGATLVSTSLSLGLATEQPLEQTDGAVVSEFTLSEGETAVFVLRHLSPEFGCAISTSAEEAEDLFRRTVEFWQRWIGQSRYAGRWREMVHRSALALKLLTYEPTGAIVAAPTRSLPEGIGGERNWDYRYAWVRDASLTMEALYIGTCSDEVENFVSFMTSSAGGHLQEDDELQIMFGIAGEHDLSERELAHLRGWRDSAPVRIGNGAWTQKQLDVYGELLIALHLYDTKLGELHPEIQKFAVYLADAAARGWRSADAGMWEMRGDPRHHLSSKVLCWAALDRAVRLAPKLGPSARPTEWAAERDEIRRAVLERGWSGARQAYAQSFDSDELDAAALLMPLVGFLPADDPRMRSTIEAIARDLTEDGLVLRYRNTEGLNADGLTGEEGTFVICSFWLVCCLARAGEVDRAEELFDRLAGYANDLGLLGEEIDTAAGEQLGNFPQAFSHIGLITAAWHIDQARAGESASG
jgi:GH15 family glucan-1,4-alpha-glucosidase